MRSAYEANFRFYRDAGTLTRVVWYFVPGSSEVVPYCHPFFSRIYERLDNEDSPDLGEQNTPIPWQGGLNPGAEATGGLCGSRDQWEKGARTSDPVPGLWPGTNLPKCCQKLYDVSIGGSGFGEPVVPMPCGIVDPAPFISFIQFSGCSPACAELVAPIPVFRTTGHCVISGSRREFIAVSAPKNIHGTNYLFAVVCGGGFPGAEFFAYWEESLGCTFAFSAGFGGPISVSFTGCTGLACNVAWSF